MQWHTALLPVALVALTGSASAAAAEVAERPQWKVGDKWVFHQVENPGAKESVWSREVVEALPEEQFRIRTRAGGDMKFDDSGNSLDKRGPDFTWQRFRFPMSVGTSWSHQRKIDGGDEKSSWQVRAYEKITVPAGTFDCFRVEGETFRDRGDAAVYHQYAKRHTKTTYWYCPIVKWAAKWETDDVAYVTAPRVLTVSELVSFEQQH